MLGAARAALLGAAAPSPPPAPPALQLLGAWPMSETAGTSFADATGSNDATITAPSWTVATHRHQRRSLRADETTAGYDATHTKEGGGGVGSLEVSNGGPAIPMIAGYRLAATSFVVWACPRGEWRGRQHWNTSADESGSEIVAGCFDLASPAAGHWLIERRWVGSGWDTTAWYWTLRVHDGSGWSDRLGLGNSDALAGIDTASRLVATFGPAGAQFWVGDALIGTVAGYTGGWVGIDRPITLGCDPDFDHANHRRPYWGRIDDVRVYGGQMGAAEVAALPGAVSSLLWKYPSDFDPATAIDLAAQSGDRKVQDAIVAAGAANSYVWQQETDTAEYGDPYKADGNDTSNRIVDGFRGFVGCRMKRPDHPGTIGNFDRWFEFGTNVGRLTTHWTGRIVGCRFDANAINSGYRIDGPDSPKGNEIQQAHIIRIHMFASGLLCTMHVDACDFMDGTSDAISMYRGSRVTVESCRFYAIYRGSLVQNENNVHCDARRLEMNEFGPHDRNGCGFDWEPFSSDLLNHIVLYDTWLTSDWDDHSEGTGSIVDYYNVHQIAAGLNIHPAGTNEKARRETHRAYYCTVAYHRHFGNFPPSWFKGLQTAEESGEVGVCWQGCIFVACGLSYRFNDAGVRTPQNDQNFNVFIQQGSGMGPRLLTFKDCELRARDLPDGIPTSLVRFLEVGSGFNTGHAIELDGFVIGPEFADIPMTLGGTTVRHRNVLHERTGNPKPWSGAGAEVAL